MSEGRVVDVKIVFETVPSNCQECRFMYWLGESIGEKGRGWYCNLGNRAITCDESSERDSECPITFS